MKIIVVDDGSKDDTANIAKEAGATVICHEKNQGYGAAIISLFNFARQQNADVVVTIDGDGQHDPKEIPLLIDSLVDNDMDVVIGSRFLNGDLHSPRYRKAGIKIITSASNYGTGFKVSDSQSGFRAYSKKAIQKIQPTEPGMAISTEILLKSSNNKLSMAEVPIHVSYEGETSKSSPLSHGVSVLVNTLKYVSVKHPLQFYGLPGIAFLITGIILGVQFLDVYLNKQTVFFGTLLGSVITFLFGAILSVTAIILFTMSTLIKDRQ